MVQGPLFVALRRVYSCLVTGSMSPSRGWVRSEDAQEQGDCHREERPGLVVSYSNAIGSGALNARAQEVFLVPKLPLFS